MNLINKILKLLGLKKEEPIKEPKPVILENVKEFKKEEPKGYEELDEQNKKIVESIPELNITPIPPFKPEDVDLNKFDEEVKKPVKKAPAKKKTAPKKKTSEKKPVVKVEDTSEQKPKKRQPRKQSTKKKAE